MAPYKSWLAALAYIVVGRCLVQLRTWPRLRAAAFALMNLGVVYYLFSRGKDHSFAPQLNLLFAGYLAMVSAQYLALLCWSERSGWLPWLAFLTPIAFLVIIRYAPLAELSGHFDPTMRTVLMLYPLSGLLIGMSYLAFRTSYLVLEVRNGVVPRPGFWEYLGFAFFACTIEVGPISPYSLHRRAFVEDLRGELPICRGLLRLVVGGVKFKFLGPILNQLTYSHLLLDGYPHLWVDLPIAAVAYYLFLYCNFSGFCDLAIGRAGLMGIPVAENFANPFAARNVKDFWNRWHITLSLYMRDVVFSPLSKTLVRTFGPANANHAIALTILVVFLLVGVWHGIGWNYAAFGAAHGLGVVANHYYTIALKKWLGKGRFAAYNQNRTIHAIAVAATFLYVAATMFFFANDGDSMKTIFSALRAHGGASHL